MSRHTRSPVRSNPARHGVRLTEQVLGPPEYDVADVGAPKAAKLYEMWHQKEPDGAHVLAYDFPEAVCSIGEAVSIVYHSDKWEADGKGYDYEHDFGSAPKIYAPSDCPLFVRSNPVTDTSKIIRADIDGDVPLTLLAVVKELVFKDARGEDKRIVFSSHSPLMCMTQDAKGLVIFTKLGGVDVPLFVRGGEMHVTSHGIIK